MRRSAARIRRSNACRRGVPVGSAEPSRADFHLPVQWVNRPNSGFRGYAGRIAGGTVKPGDAVKVLPSGRHSTVERKLNASSGEESTFAPGIMRPSLAFEPVSDTNTSA